jgi:hypothetical protein
MPPFAVIALEATSLAKRTITVPLALGRITPSITAILLPVVAELALEAAGEL